MLNVLPNLNPGWFSVNANPFTAKGEQGKTPEEHCEQDVSCAQDGSAKRGRQPPRLSANGPKVARPGRGHANRRPEHKRNLFFAQEFRAALDAGV